MSARARTLEAQGHPFVGRRLRVPVDDQAARHAQVTEDRPGPRARAARARSGSTSARRSTAATDEPRPPPRTPPASPRPGSAPRRPRSPGSGGPHVGGLTSAAVVSTSGARSSPAERSPERRLRGASWRLFSFRQKVSPRMVDSPTWRASPQPPPNGSLPPHSHQRRPVQQHAPKRRTSVRSTLGPMIRANRRSAGLTREELASRIGVTGVVVRARWEDPSSTAAWTCRSCPASRALRPPYRGAPQRAARRHASASATSPAGRLIALGMRRTALALAALALRPGNGSALTETTSGAMLPAATGPPASSSTPTWSPPGRASVPRPPDDQRSAREQRGAAQAEGPAIQGAETTILVEASGQPLHGGLRLARRTRRSQPDPGGPSASGPGCSEAPDRRERPAIAEDVLVVRQRAS